MNKVLSPGLCLDAKNSKETNSAMLRWWSLQDKYSCKASKLHLKPRRFKLFAEALENHLLKDRKKGYRSLGYQGLPEGGGILLLRFPRSHLGGISGSEFQSPLSGHTHQRRRVRVEGDQHSRFHRYFQEGVQAVGDFRPGNQAAVWR